MQFSTVAVAAALAATASANYGYSNVTMTTITTTAIETYCPGPTTLTYNDVTYTVTEVSLKALRSRIW